MQDLEKPFDQQKFSQDLRFVSSPVQPDDELLNTLITNISGASKDAGMSVLGKYRGAPTWLKERLAVANRGKLQMGDFTNGLSVPDEVEHAKFNAIAQQIDRDLPQLANMREENVQAYMEAVKGILKSSPSHPAIAALAKPNKDQLGLAIALSIIAPNSAGAIAQSLAQNQLNQQAQQQQINNMDFEAQLREIDQQVGLAGEEFKMRDKILSDEQSLVETKRQFDAMRAEADKKNDTNLLEYKRRLINDVSNAIKNHSDKNPAAIKSLLGLTAKTTGLSESEIDDIVNQAITLTDRQARADEAKIQGQILDNALTGMQVITEEQRGIKIAQDNDFFRQTFDRQIRMLDADIDDKEAAALNKQLDAKFKQIELPYVEQQLIAGLAKTEASIAHMRALTKKAATDSSANTDLNIEIDEFEFDVKEANQELDEARKTWLKKRDDYLALVQAKKSGRTKDNGDEITDAEIDFAAQQSKQYGDYVTQKKGQLEEARRTLVDAKKRLAKNAEAEGNTPVKPSISGPIGG